MTVDYLGVASVVLLELQSLSLLFSRGPVAFRNAAVAATLGEKVVVRRCWQSGCWLLYALRAVLSLALPVPV
jgi:hypothetical protein